MNREDDPQLWDLLGKSKGPLPVSPFFARNVVRAVRSEAEADRTVFSWSHLRRILLPISAIAAILVAALSISTLKHQHHRSVAPNNAVVSSRVQDADIATDLDVLTSDEDVDDVSVL